MPWCGFPRTDTHCCLTVASLYRTTTSNLVGDVGLDDCGSAAAVASVMMTTTTTTTTMMMMKADSSGIRRWSECAHGLHQVHLRLLQGSTRTRLQSCNTFNDCNQVKTLTTESWKQQTRRLKIATAALLTHWQGLQTLKTSVTVTHGGQLKLTGMVYTSLPYSLEDWKLQCSRETTAWKVSASSNLVKRVSYDVYLGRQFWRKR